MATPIVLVLGAGPGIGASVAKKFASIGYKVAVASRKGTGSRTADGFLSLNADLAKPEAVPALFSRVKAEFDTAPSVVVYNAAKTSAPPVENNMFSTPVDTFLTDLNVNTVSAYAAAQEAVKGWDTLPKDAKKTFIFTGNILNIAVLPVPRMMNGGVGKSASAYWIGTADVTQPVPGARFFYADERYADGKLKGGAIDSEAHGDFYAQLASHEGDVPWQATFVKGKGYVKF